MQREETLENKSASYVCGNCSYDFQSENQTRTKNWSFRWKEWTSNENVEFLESKIPIMDAISQVFGLSFQDLYPKNLHNEIGNIALCSECTLLLEKLYDSFQQMKKASDDSSILWNTVKSKRSKIVKPGRTKRRKGPTYIKKEIVTDTWDDNNESNFDAYTDDLALHSPQVFISEEIFENNDREDQLVDTDIKCDFKNVTKKQFLDQVRRRKNVKRPLLSVKQEPTLKKRNETRKKLIKREALGAGTSVNDNETLQWKVKHLDSLSGAVPIKCCDTSFQTEEDFTSHVNLSHENESELSEKECKFCKKKILSKYMQFHMNVLHQGKLLVYECSVCKKSFLKLGQLARHKTKEHKKYSRRNLSHLGLVRNGSKVFCDKCGKYFSYDYYLRYHLTAVHTTEDQRHTCEICGRSLKSVEYLKIHKDLYHSGRNLSRVCEKCGKVFPNRVSLKSHRTTHQADFEEDKEKFKCNQCGIILKHTAGLKKHIRLMHGKAALKTFSCEICGKTTRNMSNMRIHMKVHDPNRKFKSKAKPEIVEAPDLVIPVPLIANSYFNL